MDMSLPLYRVTSSGLEVRVSHEFASRFGGMTLVPEDATPSPAPSRSRKTAPKPNSSKEGK